MCHCLEQAVFSVPLALQHCLFQAVAQVLARKALYSASLLSVNPLRYQPSCSLVTCSPAGPK